MAKSIVGCFSSKCQNKHNKSCYYKKGRADALAEVEEKLPKEWAENRLINGRTAKFGWNEYRKEVKKLLKELKK